ncbi:uncharacterized protein TNCV_817391 [Trichonephila clavipes]|nr:uncharacterized protein TNCV_817391 [Trichonephila clavipes]
MYKYTFQDTLFICYKQSPDNAPSIDFSLRASGMHLIEDETLNDRYTINNLINYEDGQEEPDSLRADKIYILGSSFPTNRKNIFLKQVPNSERSLKFQKELRSCISGYHDVYQQLTNRPSSQKIITYFMVPKNKSIEIVSPTKAVLN